MSAAKTVTVSAQVFEDIRKSADSLPADGDELMLNEDVFNEIALCAWCTVRQRYQELWDLKHAKD
jgi:hypothetical protein